MGYGIHTTNAVPNVNAPNDDGFYITDTVTGNCRMVVSLSTLASLIPSHESCKATDTPTYGIVTITIIITITDKYNTTIIVIRFSCKMVI